MLKQALRKGIELRGPLPIASYMRQSLTHPQEGYYVKRDPLGAKGDFITSPEISQMFGELVGINILTQWFSLGQPSKFRIVELGPGRGTLMSDLLRAARTFPAFYKAVQGVQLVEASPALQKSQEYMLKQNDAHLHIDWLATASQIPRDGCPTFVIAHEFFDALPIHEFERTQHGGWQERLVDFDPVSDKFRLVLGPQNKVLSATIASQPRYAKMPVGSSIEVCPEAWEVTAQLCEMLRVNQGGALIVDYGPMATIPVNTFRAFRRHEQVNPFDVEPGESDLTADVDFRAISDIAALKYRVGVRGPVTQADWLHRMGIGARATVLANAQPTSEGKKRIATAYERLTDPLHMGKTYKAMALTTLPAQVPIEGFYQPNPVSQDKQ